MSKYFFPFWLTKILVKILSGVGLCCDPTLPRAGGVPGNSAIRPLTEDNHPPSVDIYNLLKFQKSNHNTCINQKPLA